MRSWISRTSIILGAALLLVASSVATPGPITWSPPAQAETDTSECEAIAGRDIRSQLLRQACYARIAKTDPEVCSQAPEPSSCIALTATELEDPQVIIENLDGLERDEALGAYVLTTYDTSAAELIESNLVYDITMIGQIGVMMAAAQAEGMAIAPPKDYCAKTLRGDYDYFDDNLWKYGITVEEEVSSNRDMCNGAVAMAR